MNRTVGRIGVMILTVFLLGISVSAAGAGTVTWDNDSGDNNWSTANNWDTDSVPGPGDVATFDGTSNTDCNIDTDVEVKGIDVDSGYYSTITQQAGIKIEVGTGGMYMDSDFSFSGGDKKITVAGEFNLQTGGFTSTSATLQIGGSVTLDSNFSNNSGRVKLTGDGTTIFSNGDALYDLEIRSWYDQDWSYRKKITIDSGQVSADLTDYPVYVQVTGDSDLANDAQGSGDDILFTKADGTTKLDHEIEKFDGSNGDLYAHVRVPSLSGSSDTILYMYYGNGSAGNQENPAAVWDSNYQGVYHLEEDPSSSAPQIKDSTANDVHGTTDDLEASDQISGLLDGAVDFSSDDGNYVDHGTNFQYSDSQSFSVSFWHQPGVRDFNERVLGFDTTAGWGFLNDGGFDTGDTGDLLFRWDKTTLGNDQPLDDNTWYHITLVHDGSGGLTLYYDGNDEASTTGASWTTPDDIFVLGDAGRGSSPRFEDRDDNFNGFLDEVRVSDNSRSSDWVSTTYNNQSDPGSFYTVGAEDTTGGNATITMNSPLDVDNDLTITGATLDVDSSNNTLNLAGSFTNDAGTFLPSTATVIFDGTDGDGETITSGGSTFYDVNVNGSGETWTMQDRMTVRNSLTITDGTHATGPNRLLVGDGDATAETKSMNVQSSGTFRMVGDQSGIATLGTNPATDPANNDRIDLTVDGTFHASKARVQYLTGSGIQFMDDATLNKLEETTFDFGASNGVYLNFDADNDQGDGDSIYDVKTPVSASSSNGPAWLDTVEFKNTLSVSSLDNVDADNSDNSTDAITFQNNDGSNNLSTNAIGFYPVLGDRAGASHEQDDPDGGNGTGQVHWSNGVAVVKASGTIQSRHRLLQAAVNSAGSGETVTQDGNVRFDESITLPDDQNLVLRDVLVKGTIDGDGTNNTNTLFNVVVTGNNAIGASNDVGEVYNTMVVDGSITADTVQNSVTVDTDGSGGHSINAGSGTSNEANLADGGGGLVAYWDFESGSGSTAIDRSGNGNDGTLNGPSWPNDTPGTIQFSNSYSLHFDSSNKQYVKVPGHVTESQSVTISVWVKTNGVSGEEHEIFSIGDYIGFRVEEGSTTDRGFFYEGGSNWPQTNFGTAVDDGSWHHLAYVIDNPNDHQEVYLDGTSENTTSHNNPIAFNGDLGADTFIGMHGDGGDRHFEGHIDDLRVYNRALTSGEISNLSNGNNLTRHLVDARSDDVHITIPDGITATDHPLIDKGTDPSVSGLDEDFDGNARPMDGGDGGGWDIGPDEYHPQADPESDLQFPTSNLSWSKVGEIEKNARSRAQCIYVPYITGGTGHVRAYSVDVDGGFGDEMGHFDGRETSNGGDLPTDQNGNANKAHEFVDIYVSRFWHNGWTDPGFRIYAIIDTTGNGQGDKVYAFRHVDTSGDGRVNAMVQGWSDTRDFTGKSLSNVDARRISVKLNDAHLYVVDGSDDTVYKLDTSDGTMADSGGHTGADPAFYHLPQTWNDALLLGLEGEADELVRVASGNLGGSPSHSADFGGAQRLVNRLNFSAVATGRMVYGTTVGEPHVWKVKSDDLTRQWGDGKSFDLGVEPRSFPMVFPGVSFVWGVGKDRIFKVTRSDGSKPGDWGSSADWPLTFSGETLMSDYAYWPFKGLLFVGSKGGNGYMVNAVLDGDGSGGTSSSTGETDGTVTSGWPYLFPNRTLDGTKLVWDGNWNFSIIYVHENQETGDVSLLGFSLP